MRQNHPNTIDSVNRGRRRGRGGLHERLEKGRQTKSYASANSLSIDPNKKINSQTIKKENTEDSMRAHFGNLLNCLQTAKKKQFLLKVAKIPPKPLTNRKHEDENSSISMTAARNSFISEFFFDVPSKEFQNSPSNSQLTSTASKNSYSNETRLDKKIGHSYFPIQRPPSYSCKNPHFADFICNALYKVQAVGGEGENKKVNDSNDLSPQPAEFPNSTLSENIDMHSIKVIKYDKLFQDFLDPERKMKFAKSHQMTNEEDVLNYVVMKKIHLDELLQEMEDDKRYIYRAPISLDLNDPNLIIPSFKLSNLHFLYYVILLFETRTTLTPHNRRYCYWPISTCLRHLIPILLAISQPVITPWNQTDYYQSLKAKLVDNSPKVLTSLSPFSNPSLFDKKIKELQYFSPQFSFTQRDWPCHLLLPPLHVRFIIILFDLLARLDEYLLEMPFISFRASFGLVDSVRADLTLDCIPNEFKRLFESVEKGGSLTQKFYNLRNISYQIISVNALNIFDRELQIIEHCIKSNINQKKPKHVLTEETLLNKMRHDIIDQHPYKIKFVFDKNGEEISFNFQKADKEKLRISRKFDETYVFPNYSIISLQPKNDPTLVKYDGILKSNMTFCVAGSSDPSDDQFHVQFTEDSYGIVCNYTDLI